LTASTNDPRVIRETAEQLMYALLHGPDGLFSRGASLRLIGVGCSNIDREAYRQMDLFSWAETKRAEDQIREERRQRELLLEEKKKKLDGMMEKVRSRNGENSLRKGIH
jgi:DNA polymerase-4